MQVSGRRAKLLKVFRRIAELDFDRTKNLVLVPTMGAFHEGHLHLMKRARSFGQQVVVSLFVNPTQFAPGEDFDRYPRDEARDFKLAESVGVDAIFAPSVEEMYSSKNTRVVVGTIAERWEGAIRPGHFEGVATVVAKLFNIVRPTTAIFGLKDFQQCAVIQQMVSDLNFALQLHFEETVREPDGLAMSSRNVYLSEGERAKAPLLHSELLRIREQLSAGAPVEEELTASSAKLQKEGFNVQYLEYVDSTSLLPLRECKQSARLIVAAILGKTRLIDNLSSQVIG